MVVPFHGFGAYLMHIAHGAIVAPRGGGMRRDIGLHGYVNQ